MLNIFRCFRTDLEKRVLVFEDLRSQGFGNVVDKAAGLDMDQMKMTLSNLAKWHAGTATLLLTVPYPIFFFFIF